MRILWGALRAVSVEMVGVLVVLWMLHSATGLAFDAPWSFTTTLNENDNQSTEASSLAIADQPAADVDVVAAVTEIEPQVETPRRATLRQWFNTLFPAHPKESIDQPAMEERVEYTNERLEHYSRLYGIASRN